MWKSAQFWALLCDDGIHLNSFVREWFFLPDRPDLFVRGRAKNTLFGTKLVKSRCLALRIDFAEYVRVSKVGFCTTPHGVVFSLSLVEASLMYVILLVSGFSVTGIYCFSFCLCSSPLVWHLQCIVICGVNPPVAI